MVGAAIGIVEPLLQAIAAGVVSDLDVRALLAARNMTPERRRAAALDRAHHLHLAEAHMTGVRATPCGAEVAEGGAPALAGNLTDAVKARDIALVRSLLAAGEDVNEKVQRDYPINVAAAFGPAEMVAVLLEAGADIEQSGRDGLHPLHNVVFSGRRDIVALLLQKGAAVNAKDKLGRTPLVTFAATGGSDIEIPKMLLAAGADPNIESAKEDDSPSALQYAR